MLDPSFLAHQLVPLAVAVAIGLLLGFEREMSHKPAGLRTQLLITVGTALFVLSGKSLGEVEGPRIAANVITGLGFLGGGVILQHRGTVLGLTTAALIWVNGGLGMAAALENYRVAASGTLITLLALRLLGGVERRMGKKCRIFQYEVAARESEAVVRAVHEALRDSHFQEGPLSFDRQNGRLRMRFAFCNPQPRHQEFVDQLRKLPDVLEIKVD